MRTNSSTNGKGQKTSHDSHDLRLYLAGTCDYALFLQRDVGYL